MDYKTEKLQVLEQGFGRYTVYGNCDIIIAEGLNHEFFRSYGVSELVRHFALAICKGGTATMVRNEKSFPIEKNDVLIFHPGPEMKMVGVSTDFDMQLIVFASDFVQGRFVRKAVPIGDVFAFISENPTLKLAEEQVGFFRQMWNILFDTIAMETQPFMKEIILSLLSALAMWLNGQISAYIHVSPVALKRADDLVSQFLHLVSENFKDRHRLEFYADKLCVTPKYLSAVTRAVTNKSAGKLISFFLIGEAKKMLLSSELTIAQVAVELGFPNQSSFGKFFKKEEGVSPSEFKQQV